MLASKSGIFSAGEDVMRTDVGGRGPADRLTALPATTTMDLRLSRVDAVAVLAALKEMASEMS